MSLLKDKEQDEFNKILDFIYQIPVGVCETDEKGNILLLNPILTQLILVLSDGIVDEEIPNIFKILEKFDPGISEKIISSYLNNKKIILEDYDIPVHKNNIKKIRVKCIKLIHNKLAFIIEDITLQILAEEKKIQEEILESQVSTIFALAKLAESRDDDTGKHLERVQNFCRLLAEELRENTNYKEKIDEIFIENIYLASALHDIGKVGIPDAILLKPGKLTEDEFEYMKKHVEIGANTLEEVIKKYPKNKFLKMGIEVTKFHHEKWDGSGYLSGLTGDEIPLSAQIVCIADVYDALRSKRVYKPAFSHEKSVNIILESSGKNFNPEIVAVFEKNHNKFSELYIKLSD